ncbi:helix-hairpin-helix domain-containing protein [Anaerotignum lactatifermentans]|uniref:Helix-hairpin-helix domain-containing protein n=1 Tax=Anaerotignum lactatifermentans TaxID=160404 RepID=A0ABS2GB57_9FIRM|nr:helix-hairpin-helix domain-containing protein [Anaerotignum lactatifermentans]MBM6828538.1 helix-hairpin-helix domain-containing protein [Anaerotignum lactatifermentans]MBM6877945.1 helix-hairpin-helix domain-containing protein [Anaerotignum lactatifermentans]MBM6950120.1 helix-hairpin-helix domain-containing protein [Anaerotignum lactatifermentans]
MKKGRKKLVVLLLFFLLSGTAYAHMQAKGTLRMGTETEPAAALSLTEEDVRQAAEDGSFTVNINEAGQSELMLLEGIGEKISQRIVDYRQTNGPFLSKEDIMKVSGIGEKTYENIKEFITIE